MKENGNIEWHELNIGDTIRFKQLRNGELVTAKVLSFRKVMTIVLCDNGQYELLEPCEFNNFYRTEFI